MNRPSRWKAKHIENFLKKYPHQFALIEISYDIISVYDGEYPSFTIEFEKKFQELKKIDQDSVKMELIRVLESFLNFKYKKDYWIYLK